MPAGNSGAVLCQFLNEALKTVGGEENFLNGGLKLS